MAWDAMKTTSPTVIFRRALPLALLGAAIIGSGCSDPRPYYKGKKYYRPVPSAPHVPRPPRVPVPPPTPAHYSDAGLKREIVSFQRGLGAVDSIRTVRFRYREDNPLGLDAGAEQVGVIAQELETAVPEAVGCDASGYRTVNPGPVLWTAINAIQELKRENEELRKRVSELERRGRR
jgi:hypothetical protein